MQRKTLIALISFPLIAPSVIWARQQPVAFVRAVATSEDEVHRSCEISELGKRYEIQSDGQGKRVAPQGTQSFRLHLDKDVFIEGVYVAEYRGDPLLLCQISNGESGGGFIARLDKRTLKTKWKRELPGFNVGPALIEDDFTYVTAIGFVGKVDLRSGRFAWTRSDLFRDGDTFSSFELPQLDNENVLFKEKTIYNPPAKTIVVEKKSGRILQIR